MILACIKSVFYNLKLNKDTDYVVVLHVHRYFFPIDPIQFFYRGCYGTILKMQEFFSSHMQFELKSFRYQLWIDCTYDLFYFFYFIEIFNWLASFLWCTLGRPLFPNIFVFQVHAQIWVLGNIHIQEIFMRPPGNFFFATARDYLSFSI